MGVLTVKELEDLYAETFDRSMEATLEESEEAAKEGAQEAAKEAYDETYKEVYEEAYKETFERLREDDKRAATEEARMEVEAAGPAASAEED